MIIKFVVDRDYSENFEVDTFNLDLDPRDEISNIKVHITMKFTDVDDNKFDLFLNGQMLDETSEEKIIKYMK